jgi:hypothetical protein
MDSILRWIADHKQLLVVAAAALVGYLVLRTLVRTVLPWLIREWLVPLGKLLVVLVALVLLSVQALAAAPFRPFRAKPPALVYAVGDAVVWTATLLRDALSDLGYFAARLRQVGALLLVLLMAAGVVVWHFRACGQDPRSASCTHPVAVVDASARKVWTQVTNWLWF